MSQQGVLKLMAALVSSVLSISVKAQSSGGLGSGAAWRCEEATENNWKTRVCWAWIDLKDPSHIVEVSPPEWHGLARDYVAEKTRTLAAINANWFEEKPTCPGPPHLNCEEACSAENRPVIGMSSSAGVRFPPGQEIDLESRWSLACTWGNVCDILEFSDSLNTFTSAGTSVYKNLVSGTPHFIRGGREAVPNWPNSDHFERDAIAAVGLGGAPIHHGRYEYMYLVVAEGQHQGGYTRGWRLQEMANFMIGKGVKEAIRLDSGGSAQLAVETMGKIRDIDVRRSRQLNMRRRAPPGFCEPRFVRNLLTVRRR